MKLHAERGGAAGNAVAATLLRTRSTVMVAPGSGVPTLEELRAIIDRRLDELTPAESSPPEQLHSAMRYGLLGPGKRIRPLLTLTAAAQIGADWRGALDVACAVEMIHAASLVIDDLPCMDAAELRRGRASSHRRFGESTAILAGIALLNQAFGVIAGVKTIDTKLRTDLVSLFAGAIGSTGLVAGQQKDLHDRHALADADALAEYNHQKTGTLFVAAVESGARIAGAKDDQVYAMRRFASHLGHAFQICDDLHDECTAQPGQNGVHAPTPKPSLVSVLGIGQAEAAIRGHVQGALAALVECRGTRPLLQAVLHATFPAYLDG
jgi:geranylgeranyl diphosphate synthase type II